MINNMNALISLRPGAEWEWLDNDTNYEDYSKLTWLDSTPQPSEVEITTKKAELEAAVPMKMLRSIRTQLLKDSDWTSLPDNSLSSEKKTEWATYRQELRDLPSTVSPQLDSKGTLINVTWPTQPD